MGRVTTCTSAPTYTRAQKKTYTPPGRNSFIIRLRPASTHCFNYSKYPRVSPLICHCFRERSRRISIGHVIRKSRKLRKFQTGNNILRITFCLVWLLWQKIKHSAGPILCIVSGVVFRVQRIKLSASVRARKIAGYQVSKKSVISIGNTWACLTGKKSSKTSLKVMMIFYVKILLVVQAKVIHFIYDSHFFLDLFRL